MKKKNTNSIDTNHNSKFIVFYILTYINITAPGYPTSDGCYLPPSTSTSTTTPGTQLIQEQDDDGLKIGIIFLQKPFGCRMLNKYFLW